jgi:hypothetical protein
LETGSIFKEKIFPFSIQLGTSQSSPHVTKTSQAFDLALAVGSPEIVDTIAKAAGWKARDVRYLETLVKEAL